MSIRIEKIEINGEDASRLLGLIPRLERIEQLLIHVIKQERKEMAKTAELLAAVEAQTSVINGVGTFIEELKAQLLANGVAQADIDKAFEGVTANTATAALFVNTPTPAPVE